MKNKYHRKDVDGLIGRYVMFRTGPSREEYGEILYKMYPTSIWDKEPYFILMDDNEFRIVEKDDLKEVEKVQGIRVYHIGAYLMPEEFKPKKPKVFN